MNLKSSMISRQASLAFWVLLLLVTFSASSAGVAQERNLRFPGEFEPQEAVWMAWPTFSYTKAYPSEPLVMEMLKALQPYVHVKLLVSSVGKQEYVDNVLHQNQVPTDNLSYHIIPYTDIWLRDMGPIFVVVNNSVKEKKVVDFGFNGWGLPKYFFPHDLATDEQVDRSIAAEQGLNPPLSAPIISEGGNREFNGQGTMIAIAKTELQRNLDLDFTTREQLEEVYGEFLGVKKVIWLEQGVVEDSPPTVGLLPGPDGTPSAYAVGVEHVDEVARFAGPNTILLAEVSAAEAQVNPIAAENRVRLEQAYEILRRAKDQDGKRFTIIRMPSAEVEYYTMFPVDDMYRWLSTMQFTDGSVFPLGKPVKVIVANGYMNFVITNGVVLAANYGDTTRDKKVAQILKMAFPNRKIVGINPFAINLGGGGMHCITQQEPRVESIGD